MKYSIRQTINDFNCLQHLVIKASISKIHLLVIQYQEIILRSFYQEVVFRSFAKSVKKTSFLNILNQLLFQFVN